MMLCHPLLRTPMLPYDLGSQGICSGRVNAKALKTNSTPTARSAMRIAHCRYGQKRHNTDDPDTTLPNMFNKLMDCGGVAGSLDLWIW